MAMPANADWTVDMLDALPDDGQRYELVDGLVHVTPAPGLSHQLIAGHVYHLLKVYLRESTVGRTLISPSDVRRSDRTRNRVQPDVFVVRVAEASSAARFRRSHCGRSPRHATSRRAIHATRSDRWSTHPLCSRVRLPASRRGHRSPQHPSNP